MGFYEAFLKDMDPEEGDSISFNIRNLMQYASPLPGDFDSLEQLRASNLYYGASMNWVLNEVGTRSERQWDLLALLNGNFGAIFDSQEPASSLKEILGICAPEGTSDVAASVWDMVIKKTVAPVSIHGKMLLSSGIKVDITLDPDVLACSVVSFSHVLHQFLMSLMNYDRFLQLNVFLRGSSKPLISFPIAHGRKA